ncbi:MAG: rod shape-determining protein [Candidatus Eremiobacteraeota bacterium]|nr:rod shape-determining protein [Candidatus Eremiobacteraeota bacterium]
MLSLSAVSRAWSGVTFDLGLDLGSANLAVFSQGRSLVYPACLAVDVRKGAVVAWGEGARRLEGRVPPFIEVVYPIQAGAPADFDLCEELLSRLFASLGISRPRLLVGVGWELTEVECKALEQVARQAGARSLQLLPGPLVAACGGDLPVLEAGASMLVELGAGRCQATVCCMGSVLVREVVRSGGRDLDRRLADHFRRVHGLLVGPRTAEEAKILAASASPELRGRSYLARGQDLESGLPRGMEVFSEDLTPVLRPYLRQLEELIRRALEATPDELAAQLSQGGVALAGGASLLDGLEQYLGRRLGLPFRLLERPARAFCDGLEKLVGDAQAFERIATQQLVRMAG